MRAASQDGRDGASTEREGWRPVSAGWPALLVARRRERARATGGWHDGCRCFGPGGPQPTSKYELRAPNLGW